MTQFNIAEAKANFSTLVKKAMQGEEPILAKDNKSLFRLSPIFPDKPKTPPPGTGKHQIFYVADV